MFLVRVTSFGSSSPWGAPAASRGTWWRSTTAARSHRWRPGRISPAGRKPLRTPSGRGDKSAVAVLDGTYHYVFRDHTSPLMQSCFSFLSCPRPRNSCGAVWEGRPPALEVESKFSRGKKRLLPESLPDNWVKKESSLKSEPQSRNPSCDEVRSKEKLAKCL